MEIGLEVEYDYIGGDFNIPPFLRNEIIKFWIIKGYGDWNLEIGPSYAETWRLFL